MLIWRLFFVQLSMATHKCVIEMVVIVFKANNECSIPFQLIRKRTHGWNWCWIIDSDWGWHLARTTQTSERCIWGTELLKPNGTSYKLFSKEVPSGSILVTLKMYSKVYLVLKRLTVKLNVYSWRLTLHLMGTSTGTSSVPICNWSMPRRRLSIDVACKSISPCQ